MLCCVGRRFWLGAILSGLCRLIHFFNSCSGTAMFLKGARIGKMIEDFFPKIRAMDFQGQLANSSGAGIGGGVASSLKMMTCYEKTGLSTGEKAVGINYHVQ